MKTKIIDVDSPEYRKATEKSLVMLDPHFLTMQDFGMHIKDTYLKLKKAVQSPEFQKLGETTERWHAEAVVKACETSEVIKLLEKTEPGVTNVLFYEEPASDNRNEGVADVGDIEFGDMSLGYEYQHAPWRPWR